MFSIALDETTDCIYTAQLVIFIRGVDSNFLYTEELLALQPIKGTTKKNIFFKKLRTFLKNTKPNGKSCVVFPLMQLHP